MELFKVASGIILAIAFYYTCVWLAQKQMDKDREPADRAVEYAKKAKVILKKDTTDYYRQLAKDTQKENEYLVKTGFPEQNKRLGI